MSLVVQRNNQDGDFVATTCAVLLVLFLAVNTITYEKISSVSSGAALLIAACTLGIVYVSALRGPKRTAPLVIMASVLVLLTTMNHFFVQEQQFDVMLRYVTSLAAIFGVHLAQVRDLRRIFSHISMLIIGYAAFIAATGGSYVYAGTPRLLPFWSGVASSSLLIAALTIVIALSPMKRLTKVFWVVAGLALVVGYGVVTTTLMIALFFGGWWFLRKGWNRLWLYSFGVAAVIGGIFFRDNNSVAGSDIESLGVGAIGSGRVDAWLGRFQDFAERDLPTMLVGLGPYSDYQFSALWDWEAKNAHSDLVTLLMEFGILGLGLVLLTSLVLYKRANEIEKLAFIAILFGAAASNPFLDRPVVAAGWGIALYVCHYHSVVRIPVHNRQKNKQLPSAYERRLQKVSSATRPKRRSATSG